MEKSFKHYSNFNNCFGDIEEIFSSFVNETYNGNSPMERFIFIPPKDAEEPAILFVCHLDTVQTPAIDSETDSFYYGAGFDDRTGLWISSQLFLNKYESDNIAFLFTDNEEIGQSTAAHSLEVIGDFNIGLLVELDRASNDYVFYDYYNKDIEKIMEELGINSGYGSFSDICKMEDLGITGINIGIGYTKAHSKKSVQSKVGMRYAYALCLELMKTCKGEVYLNEEKKKFASYKAFGYDDYDEFEFDDYDNWEENYLDDNLKFSTSTDKAAYNKANAMVDSYKLNKKAIPPKRAPIPMMPQKRLIDRSVRSTDNDVPF